MIKETEEKEELAAGIFQILKVVTCTDDNGTIKWIRKVPSGYNEIDGVRIAKKVEV